MGRGSSVASFGQLVKCTTDHGESDNASCKRYGWSTWPQICVADLSRLHCRFGDHKLGHHCDEHFVGRQPLPKGWLFSNRLPLCSIVHGIGGKSQQINLVTASKYLCLFSLLQGLCPFVRINGPDDGIDGFIRVRRAFLVSPLSALPNPLACP